MPASPPRQPEPRAQMSMGVLMLVVAVIAIWSTVTAIVIEHRDALSVIYEFEVRYKTPEPLRWSAPPPTPNPRGLAP